jgi:peroxiredoxin
MRTSLGILCALSALARPAAAAATAGDDARDVIGRAPPAWHLEHWINSEPLTLSSLRGSVVLVRWFMSPECPYCSATAPSLNQLHARYKDRGLVVVGAYHHKRPEPLRPDDVAGYTAHYGFSFPVAIDADWRTLRAWWLGDGTRRRWTSVTFLIDRRGVVRHVHPGGRYAPGDADFATMRTWIEELLAEPRGS